MSDMIYRDDAIDLVLTYFIPRSHTGERGEHEEDFVRTIFKALPSAEAEWIPCSDRLPSESGNYLITVADLRLGHNGEHTVTMADFYAEAKKWNSVVDVYAWMPLPKPYREDGEE